MSDKTPVQKAHEFAAIYNDTTNFPTLADVAAKLGMAESTMRHKAADIRRAHEQDSEAWPLLRYRVTQRMPYQHASAVPLSEDEKRFMESWGPEQCIAHLRDLCERHPDMVISRNFFRVHSDISESTWNRYFGTFEEFKRQAGVKLTRQQHALERHIAKHASVDHYRRANIERRDYAHAYDRKDSKRFKLRIVASDLHDEEMDPFFWRVLVDTIHRLQPDSFCVGGDGLDLPEFGKYGVDPREWNPTRRIKRLHTFCADVRSGWDGQFDYLEGNHEFRMLRHLSDETPALKVVLHELHGMSIRQLLGLDKFEINYHAKADLAAWTERDIKNEVARNYLIYDDAFVVHHFPDGRKLNMPGVNGHHHRHEVWNHFNPMFGTFEWHQMGCGHKRNASYCDGEKWGMGFVIAHIDTQTKQVVHEYIQVTDFAVVGGKFYHREPHESAT